MYIYIYVYIVYAYACIYIYMYIYICIYIQYTYCQYEYIQIAFPYFSCIPTIRDPRTQFWTRTNGSAILDSLIEISIPQHNLTQGLTVPLINNLFRAVPSFLCVHIFVGSLSNLKRLRFKYVLVSQLYQTLPMVLWY